MQLGAVMRKMATFAVLPHGWHYGGGGPIDHRVIEKGYKWLSLLGALGFKDMNSFPGEDGDVFLKIYQKSEEFGIRIFSDGSSEFYHEKADEVIIEDKVWSDSEISSYMSRVLRETCSSSASSIQGTGVSREIASTAAHFVTLQRAEVAGVLSSANVVQKKLVGPSAIISKNTTGQSQAIQQSLQSSKLKNYHQSAA